MITNIPPFAWWDVFYKQWPIAHIALHLATNGSPNGVDGGYFK